MNDDHGKPASALQPEITEPRIARQWAAIEQRLPTPARGGRSSWVQGALALPMLGWLVWSGVYTQHAPARGALIESAVEPITVRLRDGSSVQLGSQTRLKLVRDQEHSVQLELEEGRVRFDVTHVAGRSFSVAAGPALVNVVGTQFDVARLLRAEGTLVQVSVQRGVVEVRRRDQDGSVRRLTAGEEWSALLPGSAGSVGVLAAPAAALLPAAQPTAAAEVAPAAIEAVADDTLAGAEGATEPEPAAEAAPEPAPEPATEAAPETRAHAPSAHALFEKANIARRAGQLKDAAAAYVALLRRYPRDARAGISAFELGRIRMDALSDAHGAIAAFSQALRLSPGASFREDALARIVVARDTLGERAACRAARELYLAGYSKGVHALALSARCGGS